VIAKLRRGVLGVPGFLLAVFGIAVLALCYRALARPVLDLRVYLLGGSIAWTGGDNLYSSSAVSSDGLPFTYPPFAALAFMPLAAVGLTAASLLILAISIAALMRMSYLVLVRTGFCAVYRIGMPAAVVSVALATLALEPATTNIGLGQLNLVLCWAVIEDTLGPRRWFTGILVGVATGVKLVPGLFIGYFLLTRRWRAAAVSAVTAALTAGLGALILPGSSGTYFSTLGELQNRVIVVTVNTDGMSTVANQSLLGALNRIVGPDVRALWLVLAGLVVALACVAVWLLRGQDRAVDAVVVLALAGLLASPVSWTHHWVWITPLVIVLLVRARSGGLGGFLATTLAAGWIFVTAIRLIWIVGDGASEMAHYYRLLAANAYVALGLLSLVYLCWPALQQRLQSSRSAFEPGARPASVRPEATREQRRIDDEQHQPRPQRERLAGPVAHANNGRGDQDRHREKG
jgi:alpha-1,2-mannosyltransferase